MCARAIFHDTYLISESTWVELIAWELDRPVTGSLHHYKYRLAYIRDGDCVMRFDNEAGKGDHYHLNGKEQDYVFSGLEQLMVHFWTLVNQLET